MTNPPPAGDQPGWSGPPQDQPPPPPPSYGYPAQGGYGGGQPAKPSNGIGIAALVIGIVSIFLFWFPVLGLVLAILAVVFGIVGIRKASRGEATNKGMAITGVVTGGLALVGAILASIFYLFLADEFSTLFECIEQAETVQDEEACQRQFEREFE